MMDKLKQRKNELLERRFRLFCQQQATSKSADVAVDFALFFVAVVISREQLVVCRHFSSFMSSFQRRVACRNLP